jgi:hypothetical protein
MKKLIIFNFFLLLILNSILIAKEFMLSFYSGSRYEDFTYTKMETEGTFGFGVFRVSIYWLIYFLLISFVSAYIFKYLKVKLKKIWLLLILILLQIFLCYLVNRLILTNIFEFFQFENLFISIFFIFFFWYFTIFKFSKAS